MNTVLGETTKKARKEHYCWYCNQLILIGTRYTVRSGVSNDGFWNMKFHPECDSWAIDHWDSEEWECHFPGDSFTRPDKNYTCKKHELYRQLPQ